MGNGFVLLMILAAVFIVLAVVGIFLTIRRNPQAKHIKTVATIIAVALVLGYALQGGLGYLNAVIWMFAALFEGFSAVMDWKMASRPRT
jgi:hypothetical protein